MIRRTTRALWPAVPELFRADPWLVLFYVLTATQGGHLLEHVAQMVQIHVLGLQGANARGIVSVLDVEWVHFLWNTWVLVAGLVLLWRYQADRWLWAIVPFLVWHDIEHAYMMLVYLKTGVAGGPGLLAAGGLIGGGLPISRPDLHFLYNLVETVPLFLAFMHRVRLTAAALPGQRLARPAWR
jgi:hypothetical protein